MLEKHLKVLGQKIRIDILKKLNNTTVPLPYSTLKKEISDINQGNINLSFHLKTLKENELIESLDGGYELTILGKKILKTILSMEQIINAQKKTIMIRTSKYSKEPFNIIKIEEYLIKEGEMEKFQAKKIAQEVEERLSKTTIQYLTAPLMREYINAILLENGLEDVRHKLTRLGTPPYEALKLLNDQDVNPDEFIKKMGSDASEQFLLLNLLPNELADLYLSGELKLLNLGYWSLKPLGFYLSTDSLLQFIKKSYSIKCRDISNLHGQIDFVLKICDILSNLRTYISEDILLGNFNEQFLSLFDNKDDAYNIFNLLVKNMARTRCKITLEFSSEYKVHLMNQILESLSSLLKPNVQNNIPLLLLDYSKLGNYNSNFLSQSIFSNLKNHLIFYNKNTNLLNSSIINVKVNNNEGIIDNRIILDKILINLHSIALQSKQNDDIFYDLIKKRLNNVFDLFKIKEKLIYKKLNPSNKRGNILKDLLNLNEKNWLKYSIKSISFFGFNEAVKTHCGIEFDRIASSQKFALNVLNFMNDIITKKAQDEDENYILSQPHEGSSSDIIRKESNLSIEKQITIFKKFEKILNGGSIFSFYLKKYHSSLEDSIKFLIKSNLKAFNFK